MNRQIFFNAIRKAPFPGKLTRGQVDGIERILDYRDEKYPQVTDDQLAYMLATVFGETARRMQPVRETLASTDAQAIARLDNAWRRGRLKQVSAPYWREGWFGRGLVQITHKENYEKFGIADDPSKALTWPVALDTLFRGMIKGMYTGQRLDQHIIGAKHYYRSARRIINGTDRAATYAKWADQFRTALIAARREAPEDKKAAAETPIVGTPMSKSTTARAAEAGGVLGALTPALEGARQATDAINTGKGFSDALMAAGPWLLLAIVVVGLAAYIWRERKRHSVEDGV